MIEQIDCLMNTETASKAEYINGGSKYKQVAIQLFFKKGNICSGLNNNIRLLWKGVIYNRKELFKYLELDDDNDEHSAITDPEIVIALYQKTDKNMELVLRKIEGDFAFVLLDLCMTEENSLLYMARDISDVCPLFCSPERGIITSRVVAADAAADAEIRPGTYHLFMLGTKVGSRWKPSLENKPYYLPALPFKNRFHSKDEFSLFFKDYLQFAVYKRLNIISPETKISGFTEETGTYLFNIIEPVLKNKTDDFCSITEADEYVQKNPETVFFSVSNTVYRQLPNVEIYYPCLDQDFIHYCQIFA